MVWGCISCYGVDPLAKINGRMKGKDYIDLLSANLLPYMQSMGPRYTFMDDNAPCHRARVVSQWMFTNDLKCMEVWPPQSPDLTLLNMFEILWKTDLRNINQKFQRLVVNESYVTLLIQIHILS